MNRSWVSAPVLVKPQAMAAVVAEHDRRHARQRRPDQPEPRASPGARGTRRRAPAARDGDRWRAAARRPGRLPATTQAFEPGPARRPPAGPRPARSRHRARQPRVTGASSGSAGQMSAICSAVSRVRAGPAQLGPVVGPEVERHQPQPDQAVGGRQGSISRCRRIRNSGGSGPVRVARNALTPAA